MLVQTITNFLSYCNACNFAVRSLKVFSTILAKFNEFATDLGITSINDISYRHLLEFVTAGNPSVHLKKQRIWVLRQFFHFLELKI